jgi:shikimate kinase
VTPTAVLVGLPGVGKTSTGRRLAKILSVPFADSDHLVEERAGASVPEVFATSGEDRFRDLEAEAVAAALTDFAGVLALGGGALLRAQTRHAVAASGAPVIYLRGHLDELARRVGDASSRPLLAGDPAGRLAQLATQRCPTYEELATLTVDVDARTAGQVAATIAARLHERQVHK